MTAAEDAPHRDELVPLGGEWHGLLFHNPHVGYDLRLTWTFAFHYQQVRREYGTTEPSLAIDWAAFDRSSWRSLVGNSASATRFGEPIEASVYFFEHHRYDEAEVRILEQRATEVRVGTTVRGDLDGLGLEALEADQWLRFQGIHVQPSVLPTSPQAAKTLLAEFTDTTGLVGILQEHNYVFRPADPT